MLITGQWSLYCHKPGIQKIVLFFFCNETLELTFSITKFLLTTTRIYFCPNGIIFLAISMSSFLGKIHFYLIFPSGFVTLKCDLSAMNCVFLFQKRSCHSVYHTCSWLIYDTQFSACYTWFHIRYTLIYLLYCIVRKWGSYTSVFCSGRYLRKYF